MGTGYYIRAVKSMYFALRYYHDTNTTRTKTHKRKAGERHVPSFISYYSYVQIIFEEIRTDRRVRFMHETLDGVSVKNGALDFSFRY